MIIEVDDLNAPCLRLSGVSGCDTTYINPSSKVLQFLQGIKSGVDLQRAELPNGGNVVSGTPSQKDLNGAASTLSILVERAERMDPQRHFVDSNSPAASRHFNWESIISTQTVGPLNAVQGSWASFDWLTHGVRDCIVDGWDLLVNIGGKFWKFLISTIEYITKAVAKVFEAIGTGLSKIWEGLKWLFAWDDIRDIHNILSDCVNDLLDFSVAGTKVLGAAADDYLATMEKNIKEKYNPNMQLPYVDKGIEPEDVLENTGE